MMKLKVNKKLLQAELIQETGNSILLRDLSNIVKSPAKNKNFDEIISLLKETYNCTVDIQVEDSTLKSIFFQDPGMKQSFCLFPEMLFMDGTYKLLNIRCPVYVMVVENSFGTTDIVGVGILTKEDSESTGWLLEKFKERNPQWENIKVVMTDKSATERDVISKELPNAKKLICLFHTLQIFQREVTTTKLNITSEQKIQSLEYLNKLAHSKSEPYYNSTLEEMKENLPTAVISYFSNNWEKIKHEWVKCFTIKTGNFLNFTNNRLESLNSKLKSVISTYSTLDEFIKKFFILINIKRTELQNQYSKMVLKVPKELSNVNTLFYNNLTHYAYKKIDKYLLNVQSSINPPFSFNITNLNTVLCVTKKETFEISDTTCECGFFISMHRPCKHILFYRKSLGLELYSDSIFHCRWSREYIKSLYTSLHNSSSMEIDLPQTTIDYSNSSKSQSKTLNSFKKFRKAKAICLNLATLCSEVSTSEFYERMNILLELERSWQNHEKVRITQNISNLQDPENERLVDHNYYKSNFKVRREENQTDSNSLILLECNQISELQLTETVVDVLDDQVIYDMNYEAIVDDSSSIHEISLPEPIKSRGRPKGKSLTVHFGLPKKKKHKN